MGRTAAWYMRWWCVCLWVGWACWSKGAEKKKKHDEADGMKRMGQWSGGEVERGVVPRAETAAAATWNASTQLFNLSLIKLSKRGCIQGHGGMLCALSRFLPFTFGERDVTLFCETGRWPGLKSRRPLNSKKKNRRVETHTTNAPCEDPRSLVFVRQYNTKTHVLL